MEKYLAALAFVTLPVQAQEVLNVPIDAYCIIKDHMARILAEHQEKPMLVGVSVRYVNGNEISVPMVVFVNPETKSFTIAEKVNDKYCVVALGEKLSPYTK
jgi:hypothetical protein